MGACTRRSLPASASCRTDLPATRRSWRRTFEANDLALTKSGAIYFVDTAQKTVGYIDAKGQRRVVYKRRRDHEPDGAHAHAGSGDAAGRRRHGSLSVVVSDRRRRVAVNGEPFQRLEMPEEGLFSGVGGLTVDSLGYMWATSAMGIQVCEQPGRCTNILNKPEFNATPITSIAFGGPGPRMAVRHAGRPPLPARNQTHGRRRVGTGQTAATRSVNRDRLQDSSVSSIGVMLVVVLAAAMAVRRSRPGARPRPWPTASTPRPRRRAAPRPTTARAAGVIARISAAQRPGAQGTALRARFAGKDLKTLFTKIATTMPRNAPGSLADNVYLDIVAHLLKENGFPAGAQELDRRRARRRSASCPDSRSRLRRSAISPTSKWSAASPPARSTRGC